MPGLRISASRRPHAGATREGEYAAAERPFVIDTAEDIGGEQGFGAALRRFITAGLYNSDFGQLPEDINSPIDDLNNPLPYWSFVRVAGSSVDAQVVADASSASGYVLRFSMRDGTADDEAYIEQIVPVNGSRGRSFYYRACLAFLTAAAVNGMTVTGQIDWLLVDGTTATGASTTRNITTTSIGTTTVAENKATPTLGPPADAYFMRVRFGFKRAAEAVGSSGSVDFCEARLEIGQSTTWIAETLSPGTYGAASIVQNNGAIRIRPDNATGPYIDIADTTGDAYEGSILLVASVSGTRRSVVILGGLELQGRENSTLTGAQDNVTLAASSAVMRWNGASGSTWTGLTGGNDGRLLTLMNVTAAQTLVLSHDVTSTAANRFLCPNNAAVSIRPNGFVSLVYDLPSTRWRVMGA